MADAYQSIIDRDVDLVDSEYICINAKQGDGHNNTDNPYAATRYLRLTIYNNKKLVPLNVDSNFKSNVRYKKPDGHFVINSNVIDSEGRIVIPLTYQMLCVAGTAYADVTLEYGDDIISTMVFLVQIVGKPVTDDDIESTNEYQVLVLNAEEAHKWALMSKSYAVGDTGTRAGEDEDNSKYYWEQFKHSNNAKLWVGTKAEYLAQRAQIEDKTLVILTDVSGATGAIDGTTNLGKLKVPTISSDTFTYDGKYHSPTINNLDLTTMFKDGTVQAIDVNDAPYTITIEIKDPTSYIWEDGTADPKSFAWYIKPKTLTKPYLSKTTYDYTGSSMSPSMSYYDETTMNRSGAIQGKEIGSYTFEVSLNDDWNYMWNDNTTDSFPLTWNIAAIKLGIPYISGSYTYTGESQTPTIYNYTNNANISKMVLSGDYSATDAGTYTLKVSLKDPAHYTWSDGKTDPIVLTWTIAKKSVTKPTFNQTYYYTGNVITPTFNNDNAQYIVKSGATEGTDVGQYRTIFSLKDTNNLIWNDNTTASFSIYWNINLAKVTKPTVSNNIFTYDGTLKRPTYTNYDSTLINCNGQMEAISANVYSLVFTLKDDKHYTWSDGSGAVQVDLSWTIKPLSTPVPTLDPTTFSYSAGVTYTPNIRGWDSSIVNIASTSTLSASAVGSYIVTFVLKDKQNYTWESGKTDDADVHWQITA